MTAENKHISLGSSEEGKVNYKLSLEFCGLGSTFFPLKAWVSGSVNTEAGRKIGCWGLISTDLLLDGLVCCAKLLFLVPPYLKSGMVFSPFCVLFLQDKSCCANCVYCWKFLSLCLCILAKLRLQEFSSLESAATRSWMLTCCTSYTQAFLVDGQSVPRELLAEEMTGICICCVVLWFLQL